MEVDSDLSDFFESVIKEINKKRLIAQNTLESKENIKLIKYSQENNYESQILIVEYKYKPRWYGKNNNI